jgi:arginase
MKEENLNLLVAQWQGSGYTNELYLGAEALGKYIKNLGIEFDEIEISKSDNTVLENDIIGYSIIKKQLERINNILREKMPNKIFTVGGGCGIEIPIISYLKEKEKDFKIIWFDAHGDLNSPKSSKSKLFHGMPLRFLLEKIEGNEISEKYNKIEKTNLLLLGTRDLDPDEDLYINKNEIEKITVENYRENSSLIENMKESKVYIHVDLDVIDPLEFENVKCPAKNGFRISEIVKILKNLKANNEILGISILENTEKDELKLNSLKEVIQFCLDLKT